MGVALSGKLFVYPLSKSGKSRFVPLSGAAISILERVPRIAGCPFVFVNPQTLKPFTNIYFSWNNVRQRAGLPNVRLHDLRHTYASNLVNSGTSIYVVSKALGHASLKNTERFRIYRKRRFRLRLIRWLKLLM